MDEAVVQRLWRPLLERQDQVLGWKDTRPEQRECGKYQCRSEMGRSRMRALSQAGESLDPFRVSQIGLGRKGFWGIVCRGF